MPTSNFRASLRIAGASALLIVAGVFSSTVDGAGAATSKSFRNRVNEYAVKFVCGRMGASDNQRLSFVTGEFATAVNVHNPGPRVTVDRKVAVARPLVPGEVSGFETLTLENDQAVEFGCPDILNHRNVPREPFLTGFLVIRSAGELDVVAVYTAGGLEGAQLAAIHTERVPARQVLVPKDKGKGKGKDKGTGK